MELCSSIVREVLDIFLLEITEDGTLDKIKEAHNQGSQDCEVDQKHEEENHSLSLRDFSGILMIHYSILVLTLILAFLHIVLPKYIVSDVNEILIVRRGASILKRTVSGLFSKNTEENHQLEREVTESDEKENSLDIQLDRKLLKMKSEILDEMQRVVNMAIQDLRKDVDKILKQMQIYQWQNERSF